MAITAGIVVGSLALTGFGFDSLIELISAGLVLRRLRADFHGDGATAEALEGRALRAIAVSFWVLAAYLIIDGIATVATGLVPERSAVGIALSAVALMVMPALAWTKRRVGHQLGSRLVLADAAETGFCGWLALAALLGLVLSGTVGWNWADPVAGLVIGAFAIYEGREAALGRSSCPHRPAPARNQDAPRPSSAPLLAPRQRRGVCRVLSSNQVDAAVIPGSSWPLAGDALREAGAITC